MQIYILCYVYFYNLSLLLLLFLLLLLLLTATAVAPLLLHGHLTVIVAIVVIVAIDFGYTCRGVIEHTGFLTRRGLPNSGLRPDPVLTNNDGSLLKLKNLKTDGTIHKTIVGK